MKKLLSWLGICLCAAVMILPVGLFVRNKDVKAYESEPNLSFSSSANEISMVTGDFGNYQIFNESGVFEFLDTLKDEFGFESYRDNLQTLSIL